jgi:carbamoyl-phosphate synthase large subunit
VGYSLDELQNDITRETPACFEPTIDYVVTKIPRFTFEKFPNADDTLTSSMKSVGEAMAIGRTFKESFQKALRSLEIGAWGLGCGGKYGDRELPPIDIIKGKLSRPNALRPFYLRYAILAGLSVEDIFRLTSIDRWFLVQIEEIVQIEKAMLLAGRTLGGELLRTAKEAGFTDPQIADATALTTEQVKALRREAGIDTVFRLVDTCAAEFEAKTPYYYSSYGDENEIIPSDRKKVMILGGGPNRIGQGIEFDYCCVHASFALREAGFETVMVNSNPETVSTDYDTSDRLYFEPLTLEDVLEIYHQEKCWGAIVQFGGQTPLNLAASLKAAGVNIIGTDPDMIDTAEDRERFKNILNDLKLRQPINGIARNEDEAYAEARRIGFPILLRPSFVLGGRGMFIIYTEDEMRHVLREVFEVAPGKPVLLDQFLEDAIELDVDAISDGQRTVIGGMLEHIEFAGVHSGDAAMVMPPHTLGRRILGEVREATYALASALEVRGLMNIQFAIKDDDLYVLEVNPRASRTVPFVSKAIGKPLAKLAALVMAGRTLDELGFTEEIVTPYWAVKESVFPFARFPGAPIALTPEMRSTGEVMGIDNDLGIAFVKAQLAAGPPLPTEGTIFLSVKSADKPLAVDIARRFVARGFDIVSTSGTATVLEENGVPVRRVHKISEGRPNVLDLLKNREIALIINTPSGMIPRQDENKIRTTAVKYNVPIISTMTGARTTVDALIAMQKREIMVRPIQHYHEDL